MGAVASTYAGVLGPVALVASAFPALYAVNGLWADHLAWSSGVTWLYLPAALRPLAVLLFGWRGVVGLFAGGLLTFATFEDMPPTQAMAVAGVSALAPWIAVTLMLRFLGVSPRLDGLTPRHLLMIAAGCAALSASLHNLVYWGADLHEDPFRGLLPMFIGDMLGTLVMLYGARGLLRVHARLRPSRSP